MDENNRNNSGCNDNVNSNNIKESGDIDELLRQLRASDISFSTVLIGVVAVIINAYSVYITRIQLIDRINNTNYASNYENPNKVASLSNYIFIYTAMVFLTLNLNNYLQIKNNPSLSNNPKNESKAIKAILGSVLSFAISLIGRSNIDNP